MYIIDNEWWSKFKEERKNSWRIPIRAKWNIKGNANYKSEDQINAVKNIKKLYNGWEKVIKSSNGYTRRAYEAKYKSIHGEGRNILIPKQILQRLTIALAQVKAGNTSEILLNQIRQIIYSLYQAKEIIKKVYNNIMISLKL